MGKEHQLSICDMELIDKELARTLVSLDAIAKRKAQLMVSCSCFHASTVECSHSFSLSDLICRTTRTLM